MNTAPKTLTSAGLNKLRRSVLVEWAEGQCLLEHLSPSEVRELSKPQLVRECLGALLRLEVMEDHRAAALDTTARSLPELLGMQGEEAR